MVTATIDEIRTVVARVPDPEIPVLTIDDLGMLRDVRVGDDGHVLVDITPTYSGCPATEAIVADVERAVREAGHAEVSVRIVLSPAWTTDWMSGDGRRKLREFGIAPPGPRRTGPVTLTLSVRCPRCGSPDTREVSRFGSTPCKSLRVCTACLEPFDEFKAI